MSAEQAEACEPAGAAAEGGEALPQRQPRAKRRRGAPAEEAAAGPAAQQPEEGGGAAAGAPAGADAGVEGEAGPGEATPAAAQLTLQEYRSAAVPGFNFECERTRRGEPAHSLLRGPAGCSPGAPTPPRRLPHLPADLDHTADVQLHACEQAPLARQAAGPAGRGLRPGKSAAGSLLQEAGSAPTSGACLHALIA